MSVYIACECGFYDRERHHGAVGGGKCQHHQMRALTAENARLREAFDAAVAFIDSHVADPDITQEMRDRYADYRQKRAALGDSDEG